MISKVCDYINQNNMIEKGDRIVVGVSGGADSVCLLYVLSNIFKEKEITLIVVHVNHGIRGEDAGLDEQFVETLCIRQGIEYQSFCYDVRKVAKEEGLTEEEAGRKVRYLSFIKVCRQKKCNKIAIAHNKNDNAETVLFNFFRGTGIKGLSGIDPVRMMKDKKETVAIIRPLLCASRPEIEAFLLKKGISYQTDVTNLEDTYSRNKIRNKILSYVTREINSNAVKHIAGTAMQLKEIDTYIGHQTDLRYKALVKKDGYVFCVRVKDIKEEDIVIQKEIIRKIILSLAGRLKDLEAKHVEQVLSLCTKSVGKRINLPYGIVALREYDEIKFYCYEDGYLTDNYENKKIIPIELTIPGRIYLPGSRGILEVSLMNYKKNEPILKNCCMKWFDYGKIENAVVIRNREEGDYIQINQLGGRKKLKDYFIDQKIPRKERYDRLLVADGRHIMWITGYDGRISEKYKVDDKTEKILAMRLINSEEEWE
jgi:tRNA(Ile)-lysidine synthase